MLVLCVPELPASCETAFARPCFKALSFTSDSCSSWGTEIESCYVGSKKETRLWTVFRENITDKEFPRGAQNRIWYFYASLWKGVVGERRQKALGRHFLLDWLLKPVWSGASTRCFHYGLALLLQQVLVVGVQVHSSKPDFSGDFRETLWE